MLIICKDFFRINYCNILICLSFMHAVLPIQVKHCYIEISFSVNNNNASQKADHDIDFIMLF